MIYPSAGLPQSDRLRVREAGQGSHLDPLRYAGVPGPGDHPQQGVQQGGGLVGARRPRLRDGSRLSALLRRPADTDLREDRLRQGQVPVALRLRPEGPAAEPAPGRSDQALRELEGWSERYQR